MRFSLPLSLKKIAFGIKFVPAAFSPPQRYKTRREETWVFNCLFNWGTFILISNHEIASLPPLSSGFLPAAKPFTAYVMTSPAPTNLNLPATSPNSQPSSTVSSMNVLVLAQQLAAAASYYQPALLPQRKAEEGGQWRR
jgi:hypothetical protein